MARTLPTFAIRFYPTTEGPGWSHCCRPVGLGKREPVSHWLPQEVTVPPPEDMLFCAYKETRVPTYHLNSLSPANILRMEKASICDATSTPSPHPSIYRKESFQFLRNRSLHLGVEIKDKGESPHCLCFAVGAQRAECRAEDCWTGEN